MFETRREAFEEWFSRYGVLTSQSKYTLALSETQDKLAYYANNPIGGGAQNINAGVYPEHSVYEFDDPIRLRNLFDDCTKQNVRDDGAMHTAVGWYAMWLRLMAPDQWKDVEEWPNDNERKKTMKDRGYDYDAVLGQLLSSSGHSANTYIDSAYLAAIRTKPFILLAGISGTGKSRMVRQLARGLCPDESPLSLDPQDPTKKANKPGNFESIPVKPNWHDSTEILGYVTRITEDKKPKFVLTPFVKFLAKAWMNENVPFFICLDEMNLAPVEQYFAEYLSVIESRDWVDESDHSKGLQTDVMVHFDVAQSSPGEGTAATTENFVKETVAALLEKELASADTAVKAKAEALQAAWVKDGGIRIPANLVVMGTVNMDETTCSFSRKVLDRAMTFELNDVSDMYDPANIAGEAPYAYGSIGPDAVKQTLLTGKDACVEDAAKSESILKYIKTINDVLENTPFKIAYRSRNEIMVYCLERTRGGLVELPQALDEATSMKILSRIEGDEQKLVDPSPEGAETSRTLLDVLGEKIPEALNAANGGTAPRSPCEICKGKIEFMKRRLNGGFTNFFV